MICGKVKCRNLVYVDTLSQKTNWLVLTLWLDIHQNGIGRGSHILGVPCGSVGEKSTCNTGDTGSIPRSGGSLDEGMETHFNILARKIPWARVLVGYSPWSRRSLTWLKWATTNWFLSVDVSKVLEVLWFNVCFSVRFIYYDAESRICIVYEKKD